MEKMLGVPRDDWTKRAAEAEKERMRVEMGGREEKGSADRDGGRRPEAATPKRDTPRLNLEREVGGGRGRGRGGKKTRSYMVVMREQERRYGGSTHPENRRFQREVVGFRTAWGKKVAMEDKVRREREAERKKREEEEEKKFQEGRERWLKKEEEKKKKREEEERKEEERKRRKEEEEKAYKEGRGNVRRTVGRGVPTLADEVVDEEERRRRQAKVESVDGLEERRKKKEEEEKKARREEEERMEFVAKRDEKRWRNVMVTPKGAKVTFGGAARRVEEGEEKGKEEEKDTKKKTTTTEEDEDEVQVVEVVVGDEERMEVLGEDSEESGPDYDRPGPSSVAVARGREVAQKKKREEEEGRKKAEEERERKRDYWGELNEEERGHVCYHTGVKERKKVTEEEMKKLRIASEAFVKARESKWQAEKSKRMAEEADEARERLEALEEQTRQEVIGAALRAGISEGELEAADAALRASGLRFGERDVKGREMAKVELAKGLAKERGRSLSRVGARRKEDDESRERRSRRREERKKEEEEEERRKEEKEKEERERHERQRRRDDDERRRKEDRRLEKGKGGKGGRRK